MPNHPSVRLLRITNNEQSPYSQGNGASIKFQSNDSDLHGINRIHLKTSIIPNTQYNINTKNNKLYLTFPDQGGPYAEVPVGQYTINTFITALEDALDAVSAPNIFTVSIDPLTYKITITKTGGDFTILEKKNNPMYLVIGQGLEKTSTLGVLICDNIYNLSGLRHVYVESFTLGKQLLTGSISKYPIIADIPISVPFGSFQNDIYSEETLNVVYYKGFKNISNFELKLVDELGGLLELNGAPFVLVFEIHSGS
jgi:hypothetical protein